MKCRGMSECASGGSGNVPLWQAGLIALSACDAVDRVRLRFLRSGGCLCYPPGRSGEFLAEGEECVLVAVHDIAAVGHHRFVLKDGDEHGTGRLAVVFDGEVRGE